MTSSSKTKMKRRSVGAKRRSSSDKPKKLSQPRSKSSADEFHSSQQIINFVNKDIWPLERDVLMRPDRYRYVRKLVRDEGCVFCSCAQKKETFETLTLVKSKHSMVVLNKYPYNNGHLLIVPQRHCGELLNLSFDEYQDLMELFKKAVWVIQQVYGCEGMNMGMNHGSVAGAGIPDHLHWHIIPRWFGDVNFFPLIAETKVVVESLENSYHRIKDAWRSDI